MKPSIYDYYQKLINERQIDLILLGKKNSEFDRLFSLFVSLDSNFLFPRNQEVKLETYIRKLIDKAFNFILSDQTGDIGIASFYANDLTNKTAFVNALGINSENQRKNIASLVSEFIIEFSRERGMEFMRCEVDRNNHKSISLIQKFNFTVERETDHNTFIMKRDIRIKE